MQITVMNVIVYALSICSMAVIGEEIPFKEVTLLHLSYYILQLELAAICFGISAFSKKGSAGTGIGIAVIAYFLNIIANIAEVVEFLKYITPFGYCDGANIVNNGCIDGVILAIGIAMGICGIILAYLKYTKKDIG